MKKLLLLVMLMIMSLAATPLTQADMNKKIELSVKAKLEKKLAVKTKRLARLKLLESKRQDKFQSCLIITDTPDGCTYNLRKYRKVRGTVLKLSAEITQLTNIIKG